MQGAQCSARRPPVPGTLAPPRAALLGGQPRGRERRPSRLGETPLRRPRGRAQGSGRPPRWASAARCLHGRSAGLGTHACAGRQASRARSEVHAAPSAATWSHSRACGRLAVCARVGGARSLLAGSARRARTRRAAGSRVCSSGEEVGRRRRPARREGVKRRAAPSAAGGKQSSLSLSCLAAARRRSPAPGAVTRYAADPGTSAAPGSAPHGHREGAAARWVSGGGGARAAGERGSPRGGCPPAGARGRRRDGRRLRAGGTRCPGSISLGNEALFNPRGPTCTDLAKVEAELSRRLLVTRNGAGIAAGRMESFVPGIFN